MKFPYKFPYYWMSFNGITNHDIGVEIVKRVNIPIPNKRINYIQVAGRDGTLTDTDGTYEDIQIKPEMNFIVNPKESFNIQARRVKEWLSGSGKLIFSDDPDVYYRVKNATIEDSIERIMRRAGLFTALLTAEPYTYIRAGAERLLPSDCTQNPYRLSKPVYYISGNGPFELVHNSKKLSGYVSGELVIDTERLLAYNINGEPVNLKCEWKDFYIEHGNNFFGITSSHQLKIQPNWRVL